MAWGSQGQVFLGDEMMQTRDYSDETARVIDTEVERILREQQQRCRETLTTHRAGLDLVARSLLEHETISGAEVDRLLGLTTGNGIDSGGTSPETDDAAPVGGSEADE